MNPSEISYFFADPFGFASLAAYYGIAEDDLVIALSLLLTGAAGRYQWLSGKVESVAIQPPHLIYSGDDVLITAAIQRLLEAPRFLNDRYVERARGYQASALHAGYVGRAYESEEALIAKDRGFNNNSVSDRHLKALTGSDHHLSEIQAEARTEDEIANSTKEARYEGLIRPGWILQGLRPSELVDRLVQCNQGRALVLAAGEAWLMGTRAWKGVPWTALLDGADVEMPANKRLRLDASSRHMRAQLLLEADSGAIREAAGDGDSLLLDRAILLGLEPATPPSGCLDGGRVVAARASYQAAIQKASVERRSAIPAPGGFRQAQSEWEFMKQKRELLFEIGSTGEGGSLAGILPLADAVAMALFMLGGKSDIDALVLEWAVPLARRQFRRQLTFIQACRVRRSVEKDDLLAARILDKVRVKGPMSRRSLMRCFDTQHAATFRPVIDRLIEVGSLVEGADKTLSLAGEPITLKIVK